MRQGEFYLLPEKKELLHFPLENRGRPCLPTVTGCIHTHTLHKEKWLEKGKEGRKEWGKERVEWKEEGGRGLGELES